MNVIEIINQFDGYAKEFLLRKFVEYRFNHIKLAVKNEDPFEDVAFAVKIENNTYARFIYKKLFCLGKCSEKQFFDDVDKIDKALSDKIEFATLMRFFDFKEFNKLMQLAQLTYIREYIEMAKNGGYDFSTIFIETPWYDRPRYGG